MTSSTTMRVSSSAPLTTIRSRSVAKWSSAALIGLACFVLGFVALHQQHKLGSAATFRVPHVAQVRKQMLESKAMQAFESSSEDKFAKELTDLMQKGNEPAVTRKELQEVSTSIATANLASLFSSNTMDVRKLAEVGTPRFCGPKRARITRSISQRPCIPAPAPTPPNGLGICQLCVTYTYPVDLSALSTTCSPTVAGIVLNSLNIALLSQFPALAGQIGGETPVCTVTGQGQDRFSVNGPYCRGPVDPADYSAIQVMSANALSAVQVQTSDMGVTSPEAACSSAIVEATTTTVVGQSNQQLQVTLVCDDGESTPTSQVSTLQTSCTGSS